jgi:hypothetical protein
MPVETPNIFAQVIQDHLELKRRNAELERAMPLSKYQPEDPFNNHPLFKTEEQARLEETLDGVESPFADEPAAEPVAAVWPAEETVEQAVPELEESLWSRSRDFDWGD